MPAQGIYRGSHDGGLRDKYTKYVRTQYPQRSILYQALKTEEENYGSQGNQILVPHRSAGGTGFTVSSAMRFGKAQTRDYGRASFTYKNLTNRIKIRADAMGDATGPPTNSDVNVVRDAIDEMLADDRRDFNFFLYGDGSGKLSELDATIGAVDGTTLKLESVRGIRQNMEVDVLVKSSGSSVGGILSAPVNVNIANRTITFQNSLSLDDGDGTTINTDPTLYAVYKAGSYSEGMYYGLDAMINNANITGVDNYGGVDRSDDAFDFYRCAVLSNGGAPRDCTFKLIQELEDAVTARSNDVNGKPNLLITSKPVWNGLVDSAEGKRRYKGVDDKFMGWAEAIQYAGLPPIVKDEHCPEGTLYMLNTRAVRIYCDSKGAWQDMHGSMWIPSAEEVGYEARWFRRLQVVGEPVAAHGKLVDLAFTPTA